MNKKIIGATICLMLIATGTTVAHSISDEGQIDTRDDQIDSGEGQSDTSEGQSDSNEGQIDTGDDQFEEPSDEEPDWESIPWGGEKDKDIPIPIGYKDKDISVVVTSIKGE